MINGKMRGDKYDYLVVHHNRKGGLLDKGTPFLFPQRVVALLNPYSTKYVAVVRKKIHKEGGIWSRYLTVYPDGIF